MLKPNAKEELETIAILLREWADMNGKTYVDVSSVNGIVMANIKQDDPDCKECDFCITREGKYL